MLTRRAFIHNIPYKLTLGREVLAAATVGDGQENRALANANTFLKRRVLVSSVPVPMLSEASRILTGSHCILSRKKCPVRLAV